MQQVVCGGAISLIDPALGVAHWFSPLVRTSLPSPSTPIPAHRPVTRPSTPFPAPAHTSPIARRHLLDLEVVVLELRLVVALALEPGLAQMTRVGSWWTPGLGHTRLGRASGTRCAASQPT